MLRPGGALVAAFPLDALNPRTDCDNHTWKTTREQAMVRLRRAGFVALEADVVDTLKRLGAAPFPPALDQMLYIRARKPAKSDGKLDRVRRAMDWLYRRVGPGNNSYSLDPIEIIANGQGLCLAYSIALGEILRREGYSPNWITMIARNHPRGRGEHKEDAHSVIEVAFDGALHLINPMANSIYPYGLEALLREPALADAHAHRDKRCAERGYEFYNSSFWYQRVHRYARRRKNPRSPAFRWIKNRHRRQGVGS